MRGTICIADVDGSPQEFRKILIADFPKLDRAGGFKLMCCIPNYVPFGTHFFTNISTGKGAQECCGEWANLYSSNTEGFGPVPCQRHK